jgi:glycosyltransferase involved in cell wall biosynthesis
MNARQFLLKAENKLLHTNDKRYHAWFEKNRVTEAELLRQREEHFPNEPLISILVPVYKTPIPFLRAMIDSVLRQSYGRFQLILANASPEDTELSKTLKAYAEKEKRILVFALAENGGISRNTNAAAQRAEGEWTALFDHDDLLEPDALYTYVKTLQENPDTDVFYCDEDKVTEAGNDWFFPNFKPDFAPDTLRSSNYICHFLMMRTELFQLLGGLDPAFDGAQDYDLVLRASERTNAFVHVPRILYHWRSHARSTAKSMDTKNYAASAGLRALKAYLDRLGIRAECEDAQNPGWFFINPEEPLGEIVEAVTEEDSLEGLKKALNEALSENEAEYVLIRRKGTEALSEAQKSLLKGRFVFPMTGAAGPRLLYANGMTKSAGIHVRKDGKALHYFKGEEPEKPGYMCRAVTVSNVQALSLDCILIRKALLTEWLSEGDAKSEDSLERLSVSLGLFLQKKGFLLVMDPRVTLRTDQKEPLLGFSDGLLGRPALNLPRDPFYHPSLSETRPFLV